MAETITEDGEIIEGGVTALTLVDDSALETLTRVEIDMQVATAHKYPRRIDRAIKNIEMLATLDEDTAASCCYALVRSSKKKSKKNDDAEENKAIEGPSIRLAEIAAISWGNCRIDARIISVNRAEKYVEAQGIYQDLETGMSWSCVVRRRISTSTGYLYSDDMINVTCNAACAIARRNAILGGIPRGVYWSSYIAARGVIAGTIKTLAENKEKCYKTFASYGVKREQLFAALGIEGDGDIKPDHIATLRAMFATIKNGESTVEEMFSSPKQEHSVVADPLADEPSEPIKEPDGAVSKSALTTDNKTEVTSAAAPAGAAIAEKPAPEEAKPSPLSPYDLGAIAKANGLARRAVPPEYRGQGHEAEATEWLRGWDGA